MNKEELKTFVRSTLTVLSISAIFATAASNLNGNFYIWFAIAFCFQYVLFTFLGNIIVSYFKQKTIQKELDAIEPLSTVLQCAYCNQQNVMTFIPDELETATFSCTNCKKDNSVKIQFVVARKTDILQIPVSSKGVSLKDKDLIDNE
jgi:hypothetical protein